MAKHIADQINKAALRRSLLKMRRTLPAAVWREKSDRLCNHLQQATCFTQARTILAYNSFRQEPDLSPLFTQAQPSCSQRWGFPRCVNQALVWHVWSVHARPLETGAYGILEPHADEPVLSPEEVDLILVPAVACDRQGYRLGYGAGFYDRLLSHPDWTMKPTIGIVFEFAHLPRLPVDPWDLPLQSICTEAGLFRVGG